MSRPKVFGIGFHKTGTSSLAAALQYLGYRVTGSNGINNPRIGAEVKQLAYRLVEQFDAFRDNPWPLLYQDLDRRYPGSKFILTTRPTEKWLSSVVRHFGTDVTPMREWIYGPGHGYPAGNEAIYRARYDAHNREVLSYFADRPGDLLVIQITEGEGWEKLCPFLGVPIPPVPFPHANKASDREPRSAARPPAATRTVPRNCPVCRRPMAFEQRQGVLLDVCTEHGTWVEGDGLHSLLARRSP